MAVHAFCLHKGDAFGHGVLVEYSGSQRKDLVSADRPHSISLFQGKQVATVSQDIPTRQANSEALAQTGIQLMHLTKQCLAGIDNDLIPLQDKFFTQLRNSADGFNVIADFFGRGILNSPAATSN